MVDPSSTAIHPVKLLLIGGSLRTGSSNTAALRTAQALVPRGASAQLFERLADLPHFNPDLELTAVPEPVAALRAQLAAADAVLFSTPEYAGALPGSFKNLLDWTVGEGLYRKPVGWVNVSPHEHGAQRTYEMLRVVLGYVNADLVEEACVHALVRRDAMAGGVVVDLTARELIRSAVVALVAHARTVRSSDR